MDVDYSIDSLSTKHSHGVVRHVYSLQERKKLEREEREDRGKAHDKSREAQHESNEMGKYQQEGGA